ncbi:MAG: enoyl-CoA hydratase/isomerase family protein [Bacteroidales bacterium]|nr:enoyl-CoA hydratase/isomerase family protein [Bacteroidales bacterium]
MNYENILTEIKDSILTVTLNRPKQLNALNKAVFAELEHIMTNFAVTDEVKGVIITGSGEKAFAAGADIKEFAHFNVEEGKELSADGQRIFKIIETFNKPVIAAVNGFALGGGLELAMACHIRLASDNARFGQPEVSLGVTPGYAGTQRLTQLVGKGKSLELLMTGAMIKADEALNLGLVNYVVTQDELIIKAEELLKSVMKQSPVAVAGVIKCVDAYYTDGIDGFNTEVEEFGKCFGTEDFKEGTDAFMNKRKADFPGK